MYDDMRANARENELTLDEGPLLTRRHTLQGFAWAAPAIVIATSVPAQAASTSRTLDPAYGVGVTPTFNSAEYRKEFWNATTEKKVKAIVMGLHIQNQGNGGVGATAETMVVTLVVPVTGVTAPKWGIGGQEGLPSGTTWTTSGPSVSNGYATLVLVYTGAPLAVYGGQYPSNIWIETNGNPVGDQASVMADATYEGGYYTSLSASKAITAGS